MSAVINVYERKRKYQTPETHKCWVPKTPAKPAPARPQQVYIKRASNKRAKIVNFLVKISAEEDQEPSDRAEETKQDWDSGGGIDLNKPIYNGEDVDPCNGGLSEPAVVSEEETEKCHGWDAQWSGVSFMQLLSSTGEVPGFSQPSADATTSSQVDLPDLNQPSLSSGNREKSLLSSEQGNDTNSPGTCGSHWSPVKDLQDERQQNDECLQLVEQVVSAADSVLLKGRTNSIKGKKKGPRKRPKSKKHRTKVAYEGKIERTTERLEPIAPKKNPTERPKRKYFLRNRFQDSGKKTVTDSTSLKELKWNARGLRSAGETSTTNRIGCHYNSLWGYKTEIEASPCVILCRKENFPFKLTKKRTMRRKKLHMFSSLEAPLFCSHKTKKRAIKPSAGPKNNQVPRISLAQTFQQIQIDHELKVYKDFLVAPEERAFTGEIKGLEHLVPAAPELEKENSGRNEWRRGCMMEECIEKAGASGDGIERIYGIQAEDREANATECCTEVGAGPQVKVVEAKATTKPKKQPKKRLNIAMLTRKLKLLKIRDTDAIVPYKAPKKKNIMSVDLDPESDRMWKQLMMFENGGGQGEETDEEEEKHWESEREVFRGRIDTFISRMHLVLGDRRFKPWKGSVVDSVVGVYLTQNVSDNLSSSAYMSLAAKYPVRSSYSQRMFAEQLKVMDSQESTGSNKLSLGYYVTEPEADANLLLPHDDCSSTTKTEIGINLNACNSPMEQKDIMISSEYKSKTVPRGKKNVAKEKKVEEKIDWDKLKRRYSSNHPRTEDQRDSVDWEAVRCAEHSEVAGTIRQRGQYTILAARIQEFLNRSIELHGSIDLEWLREAPPHLVKKYLLEINGLGLKSVECIRLLAIKNVAFPVDVNVGRIAVRLGWVPLKRLPGNLQFHLLDEYPIMDEIQKYLWPRLCKLDQPTLYELHYQMITFGKVFCTKRNPNCNACPMRTQCKHFTSAFASKTFHLPGPSNSEKGMVISTVPGLPFGNSTIPGQNAAVVNPKPVSLLESTFSESDSRTQNDQPFVEEPQSPLCNPDIEDFVYDYDDAEYDDEEIPTIKLSNYTNVQQFLDMCSNNSERNMLRSIVPLSMEAASIEARKLKHVSRLRTEHQVYEIPDGHELLRGLEERERDDLVPYLLAIWTPGEIGESCEPPKKRCNSQGAELCDSQTCLYCQRITEEKADKVRGTILIPCRTALKGQFPLNGTYFQVNEVFADHETSYAPINVPRGSIWNLRKRSLFVGTSTSAIFRDGLTLREIQQNFWRGYVCVRGIDRKTGAPRPLSKRFHCPPSHMEKKTQRGKGDRDGA